MIKSSSCSILCIGVSLSFVLLPVSLVAHVIGPSIEKVIGDYRVDIGYTSDPSADDTVRFDLSLFKGSTQDTVAFSDAWVRISSGTNDGQTIFAGPIAYGVFGKPGFSIIFPHGGDYSLLVRFEQGDAPIVEGTFPFRVSAGQGDAKSPSVVLPIVALFVGAAGGFLAARFMKRHV